MRHLPVLIVCLATAAGACQPAAAPPTATPQQAKATPSSEAPTTAIPSPTQPLPSSTPAPAPRTFTEGFDGGLERWVFPQVDNGVTAPPPRTSAGYLRFDLTAANQWVYAIYEPQNYTDVRVDALVALGGASGAGGVVCRYSEGGGWYELDAYPDQTYMLLYGQWLAPGLARYTRILRSQSEKIRPGENQLGLQCVGNILTPYINGTQMSQRVEGTFGLTGGNVGVTAASFETAPISVLVDWVKVVSLSPDPSPVRISRDFYKLLTLF